jgi:hypothetical protein
MKSSAGADLQTVPAQTQVRPDVIFYLPKLLAKNRKAGSVIKPAAGYSFAGARL